MRHKFLTDLFYEEGSIVTLDIFRELDKFEFIVEKDNYSSGKYLTLSVKDCEETRKILSALISDFDEYKTYCNTHHDDVRDGEILMDGLHDIHKKQFDSIYEIGYDRQYEKYLFLEDMYYSDYLLNPLNQQ